MVVFLFCMVGTIIAVAVVASSIANRLTEIRVELAALDLRLQHVEARL